MESVESATRLTSFDKFSNNFLDQYSNIILRNGIHLSHIFYERGFTVGTIFYEKGLGLKGLPNTPITFLIKNSLLFICAVVKEKYISMRNCPCVCLLILLLSFFVG